MDVSIKNEVFTLDTPLEILTFANQSASTCQTLKYFSFNASLEWLMVQTFDMVSSESSYVVYSAVYAVVYAVS